MIVERFGQFSRLCPGGLHFLIPFVDRPRPLLWRSTTVTLRTLPSGGVANSLVIQQASVTKIDLRENLMDFPSQVSPVMYEACGSRRAGLGPVAFGDYAPALSLFPPSTQPIITRDNVRVDVHPALFYRIIDARRAVYETYDLDHAVSKLVQTALRSIIGDMGLDDTLASREEIERGLEARIKGICWDWGLDIVSVELLEITPTREIQNAMHEQLEAERVRRADIVDAEGMRQQQKTISEGSAQAEVTMARGYASERVTVARAQAQARELLAQAEADALREVGSALERFGEDPTRFMIGLKYIEAFTSMAINAERRQLFLPYEDDVLGGMADVIGSA